MRLEKLALVTGVLLALTSPVKAYAGDINGNEQSVLGIVQGGFEYDGVTYQAAPGYVDKVRAYLAQDDVDLTAEQASEAASEIYANIQTGVTEGYIIPTESASKDTAADSESEANPKEDKKDDKKEDVQMEVVPEKDDKTVVISGNSGMVEAVDADGNQLFVSESVIKDTGYDLSGAVITCFILLSGIGICTMIIIKDNLLARKNES